MHLLTFLKDDKNTRKIFGKGELVIIEKQLMGLDLTQSEKNRLSRDVRKKFEFIKAVSRFEEEFGLKKGAHIKEKIEKTIKIITLDPLFKNIERIILFGSAIKNKMTLDSDIDIAVFFKKIDLRTATLFKQRIMGQTPDKIEISIANFLPEKIKKEIENGKIIYKNK